MSIIVLIVAMMGVVSATTVTAINPPSPADIAALRAAITGSISQYGDAIYKTSVTIDNGRFTAQPILIVYPLVNHDIALSLAFAQQFQLDFTVRGGGHSAAGWGLSNGMMLDMRYMNGTSIDAINRVMWLQAGRIWQPTYEAAEPYGLTVVGGGCPSVGVSGFILGAGFSFLSRSYGLGIDNLLTMDIMIANGTIVTVNDDMAAKSDYHRELWWGVRGGGGGNFGVTLSFAIKMYVSPKILVGQICWRYEHVMDLLLWYNNWLASDTIPDRLALYGMCGHILHGSDKGQLGCCLTPVYNGPYDEGLAVLQPLINYRPLSSIDLHNFTLIEFERFNANMTSVADRQAYIKSGFIARGGMTAPVIQIMMDYLMTAPSINSTYIWTHSGGAVNRVPRDATAFPHRDIGYMWEVKAIWQQVTDADANMLWAQKLGAALYPYFKGAYLNYIDPLLANWVHEYYQESLPRLQALKRTVDPDNFFHHGQAIPPY